MRKTGWIVAGLVALAGLLATQGMGQTPVITSFQGNGQLSWTNAVNSNAVYSMEWASLAGGPWHSFTYQPMNTIDAHTSTVFKAEVPMFYRVVMVTNESPQGMVWIDGGDLELGQTDIADALPVHTNFISGFWMDATEVTKAKWDEVYDWALTNGYDFIFWNAHLGKTNDHPVQTVNWYDCVKWCNARSQKEGLTPCYYIDPIYFNPYKTGNQNISNAWVNWTANGYRLPTEAEWEKAARGGRQQRLFPWGGDAIQHVRANYYSQVSYAYDTSATRGYHPTYNDGTFPYTSPVGSFPANGYGLHDIAGNVWEWCWDWYGTYSASHQTDPRGAEAGSYRVLRGGSWGDGANNCRVAFRFDNTPNFASDYLGFRVVLHSGR